MIVKLIRIWEKSKQSDALAADKCDLFHTL